MFRQLYRGIRLVEFTIVAVIFVSLAGCARVEVLRCFPVAGRVLVNGTPAAFARVVFHPLQDQPIVSQFPSAITDIEGRFQLTTDRRNDGAPIGEYTITVELREPVEHGAQTVRIGRNTFPTKFANPETSELRAIVTPGKNVVPDIIVPG